MRETDIWEETDSNVVQGEDGIPDLARTGQELCMLAEKHMDRLNDFAFFAEFHGTSWSWYEEDYVMSRLESIREALGDSEYSGVAEKVARKWDGIRREARKALICRDCGVPQYTLEELRDGVCRRCTWHSEDMTP